jgi:hypothetical protein
LTSGVGSLISFWPPRRMSEPSTQKLKRRSMNQYRAALSLSDRETTIKQLCSDYLLAPSSSS